MKSTVLIVTATGFIGLTLAATPASARQGHGFGADACVDLGICSEQQADALDVGSEVAKQIIPTYRQWEQQITQGVRDSIPRVPHIPGLF